MAVATREPAFAERPRKEPRDRRLFEPGGATLEDTVLGAWEDLVANGCAECPICGGSMSVADGCESCGAELS